MTPLGKLFKSNDRVSIVSPVIEAIPVDENTNGGNTYIKTNDEISEEGPVIYKWFITLLLRIKLLFSRWFFHDIGI
jgi:hypothetical protein